MPKTGSHVQPRNRPPEEGAWSVHIATVSGIPIRLHVTFLLLLGFIGVEAWRKPGAQLNGFLLMAGIFLCVLLHELGHSVVAQRYGIGVRDITLYPIGGIARLEKMPKPAQELWIALAGPLVNVVVAGGIWVGMSLGKGVIPWAQITQGEGHLWQALLGSNLLLAGFNLLPAFPMDGGRVLRALLALKWGEARATEVAAGVGQMLAFGLGFLGLISGQFMLIFIAFFVFIGAGQEAMAYRGRALTEGIEARRAMLTDFRTLSSGVTLGHAAEMLLETSQQDFPVTNGDDVIGILSRQALLRGMAQGGPGHYVSEYMERDFLRARPDDDLQSVAQALHENGGVALVMEGDCLVGMVTLENLAEFLILRSLTSRHAAPTDAPFV